MAYNLTVFVEKLHMLIRKQPYLFALYSTKPDKELNTTTSHMTKDYKTKLSTKSKISESNSFHNLNRLPSPPNFYTLQLSNLFFCEIEKVVAF